MISFASDNYAGAHPDIVNAVSNASAGSASAYGADPYCSVAEDVFKSVFGDDISVFFVMTGTAANVISIASVVRPYESVLISDCAHMHMDECGAPERFTGSKFIVCPSENGKLTTSSLKPWVEQNRDFHRSKPAVISITQTTEYGTVYTSEEIQEITSYAHDNGLLVHMDGARISNAAAALNMDVKAFTKDAGIDFMSFGGTKNGMMFGEAVVFFKDGFNDAFQYTRKQGMQLVSKMRFVGAQFEAFFKDNLWLENARRANAMARKMADILASVPSVEITRPVDANAVFARMPKDMIEKLHTRFHFYIWDELTSEVRLMTSFETTEEEMAAFESFVAEITSSF